jgi:hypothetical protein
MIHRRYEAVLHLDFRLPGNPHVFQAAASAIHSVFLAYNAVYICGSNQGQLGVSSKDKMIPSATMVCILIPFRLSDEQVTLLPKDLTVKSISASNHITSCLDANGLVWLMRGGSVEYVCIFSCTLTLVHLLQPKITTVFDKVVKFVLHPRS